ncbi:MAG: hypothetical protein JWO38_4571 [Gemmataceae bacterium]|nr:hypothetical protein [Gemmataceae bacterium]
MQGVYWAKGGGFAHPNRQVMGRDVVVAIACGKLDFGP